VAVLLLVILLAVFFGFTNGLNDAANVIASLITTRTATPGQAVTVAGVFQIAGALLAGSAVADTFGTLVRVSPERTMAVVGAGLTGALAWNLLVWWKGLPSSSSHALTGGLVGAAVAEAGAGAVRWVGMNGWRPAGVVAVLASLAISPLVGLAVGWGLTRAGRRVLGRATREVVGPIRAGQWLATAGLSFAHGANDAQHAMGMITLVLVARGDLAFFDVPLWVKLVGAGALTVGTVSGGWNIVRTVGEGIYRLRTLDGLVSEAGSAAVIYGAAIVGGPVSTTHVVASSIVGVGAAQRSAHVKWPVVGEILGAWVVTLPASAVIGFAALPLWRWIT